MARKWFGLTSVLAAVALCGCQGTPTTKNSGWNDRQPPNNWKTSNTSPGGQGLSSAAGTPTPIGGTGAIQSMNNNVGMRNPMMGAAGAGAMPAGMPGGAMGATHPNAAFGGGPVPFPQDPQGLNPGTTTISRTTFPSIPPGMPTSAGAPAPGIPGAGMQPPPAFPTQTGHQPLPGSPAVPSNPYGLGALPPAAAPPAMPPIPRY